MKICTLKTIMTYLIALIVIAAIAYTIFSVLSATEKQSNPKTENLKIEVYHSVKDDDEIGRLLREITGEFVIYPVVSKNGRFATFTKNGHFNEEKWVKGRIFLVDLMNQRLLFQETLWRPYDINVSDIGNVLVHDMKSNESLGGEVIAFNVKGERMWLRSFKANIEDIGISNDGSLAFVATCYSDYEPHNSKLLLLNGSSGNEFWVRDLRRSEEARYECKFEDNNLFAVVKTVEEGVVKFQFDETGKLSQDFEDFSFQLQVRQFGVAPILLPKIREYLASQPPGIKEAKELLEQIDLKDLSPEFKSEALRYSGEIQVEEGNLTEAVRLWEEALELNPRVGVKRKCQAAKKKLRIS